MSADQTPDDIAAARYEELAAREPSGPPIRRSGSEQRLTNHVPVRFPMETIQRVRWLSDRAGVTVSAWIRAVVTREVEREMRTPSLTQFSLGHINSHWSEGTPISSTTTERADDEILTSELPRVATGA